MSDKVQRAADALEALSRTLVAECAELRFNQSDMRQTYCVSLMGSILELTLAIATLLRKSDGTSTPVLLRAVLEAYVDLLAVCKSENALGDLFLAWLEQKERLLLSAKRSGGSNPFFEDLGQNSDLGDSLDEAQEAIADLKTRGHRNRTVADRFERVGQQDMYPSAYAWLCQHSHNNANIVERRHLHQDDDGAVHVAYLQPIHPCDAGLYLSTLGEVLSNALSQLSEFLGHEVVNTEGIRQLMEVLKSHVVELYGGLATDPLG